jgi:16S rRNA processing protein RimM
MTRHSGQWQAEHSKDFVLIGKIIKSHGLKGEVKVYPFSGSPENLLNFTDVVVADHESGVSRSFPVKQARVHGDVVILLFAGVTSRGDADTLVGLELWLAKSDFPPLSLKEYYWFELEGMEVYTIDGRELGTVTSIFNNKAQDVLVVTGMQGEYMIPVTEDVIQSWDDKKRTLVISPMDGLLDLNRNES